MKKSYVREMISDEWLNSGEPDCPDTVRCMSIKSEIVSEGIPCDFDELVFAVDNVWFCKTCIELFDDLNTDEEVYEWFKCGGDQSRFFALFKEAIATGSVFCLQFRNKKRGKPAAIKKSDIEYAASFEKDTLTEDEFVDACLLLINTDIRTPIVEAV